MQLDTYTGELPDTIEELRISSETIFIFTADNGPEALSAGDTSLTVETAVHGSAGPWRSTLFTDRGARSLRAVILDCWY